MVAGEDQVVVGVVAGEVTRRLPHRVGRALKPVGALGCLLGGEHLDEAVREDVEAIGLRDVAVERGRVELRQHEHPLQAGVQAVADRNVDETILAADRHGRLRPHVGQRIEPGAAPPSQNQREHIVHRRDLSTWHVLRPTVQRCDVLRRATCTCHVLDVRRATCRRAHVRRPCARRVARRSRSTWHVARAHRTQHVARRARRTQHVARST